jgi:hypothetical protein
MSTTATAAQDFTPFLYMRNGRPFKVRMLRSCAWQFFWHYETRQWCMQCAMPLRDELDELRARAEPEAVLARYDAMQRAAHPDKYDAEGNLKR